MYIRPEAKSKGKYPWYGIKHPVKAVVPSWIQCLPLVNHTYNPSFWGFYGWYQAAIWVYWDWALMYLLIGMVLGGLFL